MDVGSELGVVFADEDGGNAVAGVFAVRFVFDVAMIAGDDEQAVFIVPRGQQAANDCIDDLQMRRRLV